MKLFYNFVLSGIIILISGCANNQQSINSIENKNTLTLGTIQKNIRKGITKSMVATSIGSPNIVTTENKKEIWIYDRISTVSSVNSSNVSLGGGVIGSDGGGFFGVSGGHKDSTTSQKTLTVIIVFDFSNKVEKVSYHSSKY